MPLCKASVPPPEDCVLQLLLLRTVFSSPWDIQSMYLVLWTLYWSASKSYSWTKLDFLIYWFYWVLSSSLQYLKEHSFYFRAPHHCLRPHGKSLLISEPRFHCGSPSKFLFYIQETWLTSNYDMKPGRERPMVCSHYSQVILGGFIIQVKEGMEFSKGHLIALL